MWGTCTKSTHMWRISICCPTMVWVWRIGIECKHQQPCVFYSCEEYACLLHKIWQRAYFSNMWKILLWNPWRIGTNSSRAVRIRYQFFTAWNLLCDKNLRFNNATLEYTSVGAKLRYMVYFASLLHPQEEKVVDYFQSGTCLGALETHVLLSFLWSFFCEWPVINVTP